MSSDKPLYDLSMIKQISHGNKDFVKKMLNMFIDTMPPSIQEMKNHFAAGDYAAMGGVAHKVKPTIDTMGIELLKEEVRLIERYGKEAVNLSELPEKIALFEQVISQVIEGLKTELAEL